MIIKGKSRASAGALARHLMNAETNERITLLANDYGLDYDLHHTFADMQALTELTQGKLGLYHANIDPDARYKMTHEQFIEAADILEQELGFDGRARVIVLHEKKGRTHAHVVWSRFDIETGTLQSDSHNYLKHERASMECEKRFGHEHVPGVHAKKDREQDRPIAAFDHAAWQQSERTGIDPRERKKQITALYRQSDNGSAFVAALEQQGYVLANGKRAFVIVDQSGEIHSLARQIDDKNVTVKALKQHLSHLDPARDLPDAEQVKKEIRARNAEQAKKAQSKDEAKKASPNTPPSPVFNKAAQPTETPSATEKTGNQKAPSEPAPSAAQTHDQTSWDRDQYQQAWENQLVEAAIAQAETQPESPRGQTAPDTVSGKKPSRSEKRLASAQQRLDASVKQRYKMDRRAEVLAYRQDECKAAFSTVFRQSEKAYARFQAVQSREGFGAAMRLLEKEPKKLGRLRGNAFLFADKNRRSARKALPKLAKQAIRVRGLEKKVERDRTDRPFLNSRIIRQTYKRDQLETKVQAQAVSTQASSDIADTRPVSPLATPERKQENGVATQAFDRVAPADQRERSEAREKERLAVAKKKVDERRARDAAQRQRSRGNDWENTL